MSKPEYIIYRARCRDTSKVYIGMTSKPLKVRWRRHIYASRQDQINWHFPNALQKHGPEAFSVEQIDSAGSYEEACEKERQLISDHNAIEEGYNIKSGGNAYDPEAQNTGENRHNARVSDERALELMRKCLEKYDGGISHAMEDEDVAFSLMHQWLHGNTRPDLREKYEARFGSYDLSSLPNYHLPDDKAVELMRRFVKAYEGDFKEAASKVNGVSTTSLREWLTQSARPELLEIYRKRHGDLNIDLSVSRGYELTDREAAIAVHEVQSDVTADVKEVASKWGISFTTLNTWSRGAGRDGIEQAYEKLYGKPMPDPFGIGERRRGITDEKVREILREYRETDKTQQEVADEYEKVTRSMLANWHNRKD
jgi:transposase-like protein